MEDDLYDEFGNYIGEESEEDNEDEGQYTAGDAYLQDDASEAAAPHDDALMEVDNGPSNAVILHEDKQYYPTASQVYGRDVETMVQEEDAQLLAEPIVKPVVVKK